ncbi:unnamed protein product [Porites lobata]|uniref:Uncharacterized protein n=1 Tax=Porites lobata TaxID=104759 RepID=A0ABN8P8A6_9CNID|nr:unnamed protein product [Porites lobata]
MLYVSLIALAFLLAPVGGAKSQCSVAKVCGALDNVLRQQDLMEKKVNAILGGSCPEADKFSVAAVVDCTSLVKSFPVNLYYTLNTQATLQLCRVLAHPSEESQTYTVSAELFNKAGWNGIHSGHLGLLFNVVDEYNFDFVYLRPHSSSGCYQTGYMASGKLTFVKSAACPNGPPKGGVWFPVSVTVHGQDAQVYHSGVLVATIKPHFPPRAWGGVFAYNGYKNVILFGKFKTVPIIHVSKRCKRVVELPGYTKVDAAHGRWPQDGFCQVAYLRDHSTSSYQLSVDMYNFIGWRGANSGHPGVLLNAEDQDNYDFVYFRPHSSSTCFQTGYVYKGQPKFDGGKSASCPNGPPKGAEWFNIRVAVSNSTPAGEVKVYLKGTLVTSFNPRYPIRKRGGVLVANGYSNVVYYKNFKFL